MHGSVLLGTALDGGDGRALGETIRSFVRTGE